MSKLRTSSRADSSADRFSSGFSMSLSTTVCIRASSLSLRTGRGIASLNNFLYLRVSKLRLALLVATVIPPPSLTVLCMGQDGANEYPSGSIMYLGYQAIVVSLDVKHRTDADKIRMRKISACLSKTLPVRVLGYAIP